MSSVLAQGLGRVFAKRSALRHAWFSEDFEKKFLVDVVKEACAGRPGTPPFAILVAPDDFDGQATEDEIEVVEDPDSTAAYREGHHVVVSRAGDFSSISTLQVFLPLFNEDTGLPAIDLEDLGTAEISLADIAEEIASITLEDTGPRDVGREIRLLAETVEHVYTLTADAFRRAVNKEKPWVDRWWIHLLHTSEQLARVVRNSLSDGFAINLVPGLVFASAGLPQPEDKANWRYKKAHDARALCAIVEDHWSDAEQARATIRRLEASRDDGQRHPLETLEWSLLAETSRREGHAVAAMMLHGLHQDDDEHVHAIAWHATNEDEFFGGLRRTRAGTITFSREEVELPTIGLDGLYVLPTDQATIETTDNARPSLVLGELELRVPPRTEEVPPDAEINPEMVAVSCARAGYTFQPSSVELRHGQLCISGTFRASFAETGKWNDRPFKVYLELVEEALESDWSMHLDTDASASLVLPSPVVPLFCILQERGAGFRAPQFVGQCRYSFEDDAFHAELDEDTSPVIDLKGTEQFNVFAYDGGAEQISGDVVECGDEVGQPDEHWPRASSITGVSPSDGLIISLGETSVTIMATTDGESPFLPLAATAIGTHPSNKPAPEGMQNDLRGRLEEFFFQPLVFDEPSFAENLGETLGQVAIPVGNVVALEENEFCKDGGLFWPTEVTEQSRTVQHAGKLGEIFAAEELEEFWSAFRGLDLDKAARRQLRTQEGSQLFWPSRTSLKNIDQERVEDYLSAFTKLVQHASELDNPAARFWASFPFSVFVVDPGEWGSLKAVLLSPLHPVRLAWLWSCEQVVADWHRQKQVDPRLLQLVAGWNFPMVASSLAPLAQRRVAAVPIDTGEEDVFLGWSALVDFDNTAGVALRIPERAAGLPMPGASSSGLSEGGIGAALRDFLRVFPHISTLTVDLAADSPTPRMKKLDEAIIAELADIVGAKATGHQLPGGVRVWDSINRRGEPPSRDEVLERANLLDVPFPFAWQRYQPTQGESSDLKVGIRFVQDAASAVAVVPEGHPGRHSLVPPAPLRRFMSRTRDAQGRLVVSLRLEDPENPLLPTFSAAVRCMELVSADEHPELSVQLLANIATDSNAEWIVTGDMHLDPVTLNEMIENRPGDSRRMIWEWRPSYLPRKTTRRLAFFERRPYVSIATIPEAFRDLLGETIKQLVDGNSIPPDEASDRVISMLGIRGVGLSSLLAMGHHHETGALGFFFAFQLCEGWQESRQDEHVAYYVLPVDAVDELLGEIVGDYGESEETRRADLLVLEVDTSVSPTRITIVPIEIKFYGLRGEASSSFPVAGGQQVSDGLQQLNSTLNRIENLVQVQPDTSLLGDTLRITGFATLLETAFLLSIGAEKNPELELLALRDTVSGKTRFQRGRGTLLRFQVLQDNDDEPSQVFLDVESPHCPNHAEVFINPTGCGNDLWDDSSYQAGPGVHADFQQAMSWCLDPASEEDDGNDQETAAGSSSDEVAGDQHQAGDSSAETDPADGEASTAAVEIIPPGTPDEETEEQVDVAVDASTENETAGTGHAAEDEPTPPDTGENDDEMENEQEETDEDQDVDEGEPIPGPPPGSPGLEIEIGTSADTISSRTQPVLFTPSDTRLTQLNIGIIGDLGTGKTQLVKSLLYQLSKAAASNRGHAPRMLILDYKGDYIDPDFVAQIGGRVLDPSNIPLNFFSTDGCTSLNPRYERGRFFTDILTRIYSGLGPVQKVNLGKAVELSYATAGAREVEPTLYDVLNSYKEIAGKTDSVEAILDSLTRSGLFQPDPTQLVSFEELFDKTTIVNLHALGGDQESKNMLVTIFLNFYYEYMLRLERQDFIETDDGRSLRYVDSFLLVDEANNILSYDFDVLEQLLLQGREFGTGVILASQFLSHFEQGQTNWKEPLHTWFLHQVPDINEKDLQRLGIVSDTKTLAAKIKELDLFYCAYKGLGFDGRIIRTRPFFELPK
jgi:hypothetical protein